MPTFRSMRNILSVVSLFSLAIILYRYMAGTCAGRNRPYIYICISRGTYRGEDDIVYMRCMRLSKCNNNVRPLINAEAGVSEWVSGGAEEGREIETKSERVYTIHILYQCLCVCRKDTNESVGGHFAPWGSISTIFGSIVYGGCETCVLLLYYYECAYSITYIYIYMRTEGPAGFRGVIRGCYTLVYVGLYRAYPIYIVYYIPMYIILYRTNPRRAAAASPPPFPSH